MTILLINFPVIHLVKKAIEEQQPAQFWQAFEWTDAFLYNGANGSTGLIFCLDSKTINTLTDYHTKSIVGQTTSVCGGGGGGGGGGGAGQQQQQQKFTQTLNSLDRPVKKTPARRNEMRHSRLGQTSMKFSSIRAFLGHSE